MRKNQRLKIQTILDIDNAALLQGNSKMLIPNISIDTRTLQKGDVFFAIKSGNDFLETAIEKGAVACIVEKMIPNAILKKYPDITFVEVNDTIKSLQKLARYKRQQYEIPVIAITGSVGKTSTKDMIASVLSEKFDVLKTEGNYNNHLGVPLTILKLRDQTALVLEMGMNHKDEISTLTEIANPTIAVITNIGTSHIGILGSRENILNAKLEILEGLAKGGTLVMNYDNDLLKEWKDKRDGKIKEKKKEYKWDFEGISFEEGFKPVWEYEMTGLNIVTYGLNHRGTTYRAQNVQVNENGSTYEVSIYRARNKVEVPISGMHFVYNSLAALSVGKVLHLSNERVFNGVKNFELTKKRMELEDVRGTIIINDTYNASYESMKCALEYLKNKTGKRKIAVLGDMFELGKYSQELHEKVGEEADKNNIDVLITVGENSKYIDEKAINVKEKYRFENNEEAAKKLKEIMKKEDIVLLKASNGMKFGQILEGIR